LDNYWPNWSISSFANYKIELAPRNFARSGPASFITIVHADAGRVLERAADSAFDFIFLDSERTEYPGWWPNIRRVLRPGGLLVVDSATSHPEEMAPFIALVKIDSSFTTSLVPVGNGELMVVKAICEAQCSLIFTLPERVTFSLPSRCQR